MWARLITILDWQISAVMDRFESQFEDLDVAPGYYENATSATAVGTPQEDVDRLMNQVADEAGVELHQEMEGAKPVASAPVKSGPTEVEEDGLGERLRSFEIVSCICVRGIRLALGFVGSDIDRYGEWALSFGFAMNHRALSIFLWSFCRSGLNTELLSIWDRCL